MRLIIRWRCGDTNRWDRQLRQTTVLFLYVFLLLTVTLGSFISTRMKTLATLSASGLEAVFEVCPVNYAWSTRSCLFLLMTIINIEVFRDSATSMEVDVTRQCLLISYRSLKRKLEYLCWLQWTPEMYHPHARAISRRARKRSTAQ